MVKIHGIVYLTLGILILAISYKIDAEKLQFFIFAGYVFLAVGVAKLIWMFVNRQKESEFEKKQVQRQMQAPAKNFFCPRCKLAVRGYENFCPRCGFSFRPRMPISTIKY